jgi:predicted TIM-barrel fold metal-dependent hydrolase
MPADAPAAPTSVQEEILEPGLPICDPHHHLWHFPDSRYLLEELLADIGPGDGFGGHRVESTVFVECTAFYRARGPEPMKVVGETEFVAGVAAMADSGRYGPVRACEAIVGRADLGLGAAVDAVLKAHVAAGGGRFRGIRHAAGWDASEAVRNSHTEPSQHLYLEPAFREGFARLAPNGLSFEAWQYHTQLPDLLDLARAFPDTQIMLDHVGGPLGIGPYAGRRDEIFQTWRQSIRALAGCPNVWVKLGGLGMAICGFDHHRRAVLPGSAELAEAWRPYIETCIEAFGPERGMFESNFPVDKVSCSYEALWNAFKRLAAGASATEKARLFRDSARDFYRLEG